MMVRVHVHVHVHVNVHMHVCVGLVRRLALRQGHHPGVVATHPLACPPPIPHTHPAQHSVGQAHTQHKHTRAQHKRPRRRSTTHTRTHLCDLDLQLVCVDEELWCHAKASAGHLLDLAGRGVAVLQAAQVRERARLAGCVLYSGGGAGGCGARVGGCGACGSAGVVGVRCGGSSHEPGWSDVHGSHQGMT
jgi:hypothetical protein